MLVGITRAVSPTLAQCQLTHLAREPIDVARAEAQHAAYEDALRSLGAEVVRVPPAPELPDAVFVEDIAVVLDEVAVIARPGAPTRRAEVDPVAAMLADFRPLLHLTPPATLDGGDVLALGATVYVGMTTRTNLDAAGQLRTLLKPFGYAVVPVPVSGCLHLKSAVTQIGERRLLMNPEWVRAADFGDAEPLFVDPAEPGGANALWIEGSVVYPAQFPRTAERLAAEGLRVMPVECSELAKAEGGVTCCSLVFRAEAT